MQESEETAGAGRKQPKPAFYDASGLHRYWVSTAEVGEPLAETERNVLPIRSGASDVSF